MKEKFAAALLLQFAALLSQAAEHREALDDPAGEGMVDVPLGALPEQVLSAARDAAPSVYFTSAERYLAADIVVYRLQGRLFREVWDVYVRENGALLRASADNQDD